MTAALVVEFCLAHFFPPGLFYGRMHAVYRYSSGTNIDAESARGREGWGARRKA